MQVEIFSDIVCPWCYLGKRRFEGALASFEHRADVHVVHRSFQLDPSAPADHTVPTLTHMADKFGMSAEQARQAHRQMEQRAAADGLEYHLDGQRSGNTFRAHRLLQFARTRDRGDDMIERLFAAYFTQQRSVFETDSLVALAVEAGLDAAEAEGVLGGDDYTSEVEHDLAEARSFGISGVPFFVLDRRYGVSGAQPVEVFGRALAQAWDESSTASA